VVAAADLFSAAKWLTLAGWFATARLVEWYRAGLDVNRELPKLATYLGHVDVGLTYWYIEAVPELLQLAAEYLGVQQSGGES